MKNDLPIVSKTLPTTDGHKIGVLTLNMPHALNAVDLDMVNRIDRQLSRWEKDDNIVAVFLCGAGDKAFSAGGDIRKLYYSTQATGEEYCKYADAFFASEYGKNYRVHLFQKPLIAWGNGFVMGGGLGLFIGANIRVGTETLKLAWPEIRIGLFPDVTGTWYLSHLPYPVGHWMGLSASHMNAVDSKQLEFIHYTLGHDQKENVLEKLCALPWQHNTAENHSLVRTLLQEFEHIAPTMPESQLDKSMAELIELFSEPNLNSIDKKMRAYTGENEWLKLGISHYVKGCPATAHVVMEQLLRGANMSLREVVQWELELACQAMRNPDFAEGVRAMVIEKDFTPRWQHTNVQAVPAEWVKQLLSFTWENGKHPLHKLPTWKR